MVRRPRPGIGVDGVHRPQSSRSVGNVGTKTLTGKYKRRRGRGTLPSASSGPLHSDAGGDGRLLQGRSRRSTAVQWGLGGRDPTATMVTIGGNAVGQRDDHRAAIGIRPRLLDARPNAAPIVEVIAQAQVPELKAITRPGSAKRSRRVEAAAAAIRCGAAIVVVAFRRAGGAFSVTVSVSVTVALLQVPFRRGGRRPSTDRAAVHELPRTVVVAGVMPLWIIKRRGTLRLRHRTESCAIANSLPSASVHPHDVLGPGARIGSLANAQGEKYRSHDGRKGPATKSRPRSDVAGTLADTSAAGGGAVPAKFHAAAQQSLASLPRLRQRLRLAEASTNVITPPLGAQPVTPSCSGPLMPGPASPRRYPPPEHRHAPPQRLGPGRGPPVAATRLPAPPCTPPQPAPPPPPHTTAEVPGVGTSRYAVAAGARLTTEAATEERDQRYQAADASNDKVERQCNNPTAGASTGEAQRAPPRRASQLHLTLPPRMMMKLGALCPNARAAAATMPPKASTPDVVASLRVEPAAVGRERRPVANAAAEQAAGRQVIAVLRALQRSGRRESASKAKDDVQPVGGRRGTGRLGGQPRAAPAVPPWRRPRPRSGKARGRPRLLDA